MILLFLVGLVVAAPFTCENGILPDLATLVPNNTNLTELTLESECRGEVKFLEVESWKVKWMELVKSEKGYSMLNFVPANQSNQTKTVSISDNDQLIAEFAGPFEVSLSLDEYGVLP